jgi:hypothetical protein
MTKDGSEVATATGRGEGKMTDSGKMRYPGAIFYATHSLEGRLDLVKIRLHESLLYYLQSVLQTKQIQLLHLPLPL